VITENPPYVTCTTTNSSAAPSGLSCNTGSTAALHA
jgi:hypothetical protein